MKKNNINKPWHLMSDEERWSYVKKRYPELKDSEKPWNVLSTSERWEKLKEQYPNHSDWQLKEKLFGIPEEYIKFGGIGSYPNMEFVSCQVPGNLLINVSNTQRELEIYLFAGLLTSPDSFRKLLSLNK